MNNSDIENILNNDYSRNNKKYYVIDGRNYYIDVIGSIDENTSYLIAGSNVSEESSIWKNISNQNCVIITPENYTNEDLSNISNIVNLLSSSTNINIDEEEIKNYLNDTIKSGGYLDDETISSNLDFVSSAMNSIVTYIDPSGKLLYVSSPNEAGLFGAMYDVTSYYRGINNTLYSGVAFEADAISSMAQSISVLDQAGAIAASSSIGSIGSSGGGNSKSKSSSSTSTVQGLSAEEINESTKRLIESTKNAALSSNYSDIASFLGETITPGKVGKVSVDKLGETLNSLIPTLEEDARTCSSMISSIDDFLSEIKSNSKLKGKIWKAAKKNLKKYKSLLKASIDSSEFLSNVLETAKIMIEEFLYPDTEIDDSILPELEQKYSELNTIIDELSLKVTNMRNSQKEIDVFEYNGKTKKNEKVGTRLEPTDEEIQLVQNSLDAYQKEADEIKLKIDKIKEFSEVMNKAQKLINDALEQVKNVFENPVKDSNGNETFRANFNLDLSALGITYGTESGDYISGYLKSIGSSVAGKFDAEELLSIGDAQRGVKYHSMHYGPDGSGDEGFGCAMFVAYCFNTMMHPGEDLNGEDKNTSGFYGGCKDFFGNITTDDYDPRNKGFVEVSREDRQAGDIVCFCTPRYSDDVRGAARNCFHVALYTGEDNKILHSTAYNSPNGVGYSTIGQYRRAKTAGLNNKAQNGRLSDEDRLTWEAVQSEGIEVIYLRYVGE